MIICCVFFFFFSSRRRHTRSLRDWSSDVCSSDLWFECHSAVPLPLLRTAVTSTPSPPPSSLRPSSPFIGRSGGVGPGREPWLQPNGACSCLLCSGFPMGTDPPTGATEQPRQPLSSSTLPGVAKGLSQTGERAKSVPPPQSVIAE